MAKVFTTVVFLKTEYGDEPLEFTTPEVYMQTMKRQDLHTYNGTTEIFIPWHSVGHVLYRPSESESEASVDAFCGGEA